MGRTPQLPLQIQLQQSASFSNYVAHKNHTAVGQLLLLLEADEQLIFISGPRDSGRSHLLFATCNQFNGQQTSASYLPLIKHRQMQPEALEGLEGQRYLCLDDIDAICGLHEWEVALFSLINRIRDCGHTLVISAAQTPRNLAIELPDLRSRLSAGVLLQLTQEEDETKREILQRNGMERGLELSREVCNYLLTHYRRDLGSLITLLDDLDREALVTQRRITIPFIKGWLQQLPTD